LCGCVCACVRVCVGLCVCAFKKKKNTCTAWSAGGTWVFQAQFHEACLRPIR
jgi:hypothetical protein